jgi:hypothetical protein
MAALLAVVLPISCGSSGQSSKAEAIPNSEFLAKARPICEKNNAELSKRYAYWAERAHFHADSEKFMDKVAAKIVIPGITREVRELRAVGLPEGREKKVEAFLAALEEGVEKGREDWHTLRGGPYAFQRALDLADGVGLVACFTG